MNYGCLALLLKHPLSDLQTCPWCNLEKNSGVFYFLNQVPTVVGDIFDFNRVWAQIQAIQPAPIGSFPVSVPYNSVSPTSLPPSSWQARLRKLGRFGQWLYSLVKSWDTTIAAELSRRQQVLDQVRGQWQKAQRFWHQHNWNEAFDGKKRQLEKAKQEWEKLSASYNREKEQASLVAYLDRFLIEDADIPKIGKQRTMELRSWGIETAADVKRERILAVYGFGPKLTGNLLDWRNRLEGQYQRLPQAARKIATPQLDQKFAQQRQQLEKQLRGGAEELEAINRQIVQDKIIFFEQCRRIAQKLAQAEVDVAMRP